MGLAFSAGGPDRGGGAFRTDAFPLAARGVVALSLGLSGKNLTLTKEEVQAMRARAGRWYHQPSDELPPRLPLRGHPPGTPAPLPLRPPLGRRRTGTSTRSRAPLRDGRENAEPVAANAADGDPRARWQERTYAGTTHGVDNQRRHDAHEAHHAARQGFR